MRQHPKKNKNMAELLGYIFVLLMVFFAFSIFLIVGITPLRLLSQRNQLEKTANKLIQNIEATTFTSSSKVLSSLCNTNELKQLLQQEKGNIETLVALNIAKKFLNASIVYLMDTNGHVIASTNFIDDDGLVSNLTGNNYAFRPYFIGAMKGENVIYPAVGVTTGKRGIYCSSPVFDNKLGNTIGVLAVKLGLEVIDSLLNQVSEKVLIFSPEDIVFATNEPSWLYGTMSNNDDSIKNIIKSIKQFNENSIKPLPFDKEDDKIIFNETTFIEEVGLLSSENWHMLVLAKQDYEYPLNKSFIKTIIITLAVIIVLTSIILLLLVIIRRKRKIELELRHNKENLRIILDSIGDGVIATDISGRIIQMNPVAVKLIGLSKGIAIGNPLEKVFKVVLHNSKKPFPDLLNSLNNEHVDKKVVHDLILLSNNGIEYEISELTAPIRNSENLTVGMVVVFRDITHQKETKLKLQHQYEQLKKALNKVEESDRLKTAFLQNISHEIRTPLNGIIGFSGLMGDDTLNTSERKEYANCIAANGLQLLEVIHDVVEVSKLEASQVKLNIVEDDVHKIINELYLQFNATNRNANVKFLKYTPPERTKYLLETDHKKLRKVLHNLLHNAFKFTNFGSIEFGYSLTDLEIEFKVKDSGIGVSVGQQSEIFNLFTQAKKDSFNISKGTGIGLTIVKKYVLLLNGKIGFESEINKGSEFIVSIPISK